MLCKEKRLQSCLRKADLYSKNADMLQSKNSAQKRTARCFCLSGMNVYGMHVYIHILYIGIYGRDKGVYISEGFTVYSRRPPCPPNICHVPAPRRENIALRSFAQSSGSVSTEVISIGA